MAIKFAHHDQEFSVGDTVRVNYKIKEKDKERIQAFEGIIITIKGRGVSKTFTVLKSATDAVRVERIFPINSPWIDSIKRLRSPKRKIRRSKLYFLRNPKAKNL